MKPYEAESGLHGVCSYPSFSLSLCVASGHSRHELLVARRKCSARFLGGQSQ